MARYRRNLPKLIGEALSSNDHNVIPHMLDKIVKIVQSALSMEINND